MQSKQQELSSDQGKSEGAVRAQKARIRAQMKALPLDVQYQIEKHCAENDKNGYPTTKRIFELA